MTKEATTGRTVTEREPEKGRPCDEPPFPQIGMDRRTAINAILFGAVATAAAVTSVERGETSNAASPRESKKEKRIEVRTSVDLNEHELTQCRIQAFEYAFSSLTQETVLFLDQDSSIIGGKAVSLKEGIQIENSDSPELKKLKTEMLDAGRRVLELDEAIKNCVPNLDDVDKLREDARSIRDRERRRIFLERFKDLRQRIILQSKFDRDVLRSALIAAFQKWANLARQVLKAMYPGISIDLNPKKRNREMPELVSERLSLAGKNVDVKHIDLVLFGAKKPVSKKNQKRRMDYAARKFEKSKILPESIKQLMPGLCGVESQFDDAAESSDEAVGAWQLTIDAAEQGGIIHTRKIGKGKGRKVIVGRDNRISFELATQGAVGYMEYLYKYFQARPACEEIKKKFGFSDEDFIEHFMTPVTINAYHSGMGNLRKIIEWFAEKVSTEDVKRRLGNPPYGKDIYTLMSELYMEFGKSAEFAASNGGKLSTYDMHSRNYFHKVTAMNGLLANPREIELTGEYREPVRETVDLIAPRESFVEVRKSTRTRILELLGIAMLGSSAYVILQRESTRRQFWKNAGRMIFASGLGKAIGFGLSPREPESAKIPEPVVKKVPSEPGRSEVLQGVHFDPKVLNAQLIKENVTLPRARLLTIQEEQKLRDGFRNGDFREWADSKGKKPIPTDAILYALKGLVDLAETCATYRLRGVGNPKGGHENDLRYARLYPHAASALEELSKMVNDEVHKAGLPAKYAVRLVITGAARSNEYQQRLRRRNGNAAQWSSHTLANSFDISWKRFDIVDTETGAFTMVLQGTELDAKLKLATSLEAILGKAVLKLVDEKRVMARQEMTGQAALHIVVTGS